MSFDYKDINHKEPVSSKVMETVCKESKQLFDWLKPQAIEGQILANYKYFLAYKVREQVGDLHYKCYHVIPVVYRGSCGSTASVQVSIIEGGRVNLNLPISTWKQDWYLMYHDAELDF